MSEQERKAKGSDLFVAALENEGVDRIFGVPGEENLDLVESLRTSKIQLILTRHEQAAAFMAATHGRLTGKPGVCLSALGPGALPERRRGRDHEAADEIVATDHQRLLYPDRGARRLTRGDGGAAGTGAT